MSNKKSSVQPTKTTTDISTVLIKDIASLINDAKQHVAREYNSTQALLCWLIGVVWKNLQIWQLSNNITG